MVHGGGWRRGDKAGRGVVGHKATHWLPRGYILVSMNYRMLPEAGPATQAEDVAAALVYVQQNARSWGGDGRRIVVMGHSAGAHLVALLAADSDLRTVMGVEPWPASVLLDSAAYDVVSIMEQPHPRLYDVAFGPDPVLWAKASPSHRMVEAPSPMLLVCSEKRDVSCPSATAFGGRIAALGGTADVVPVDLSHLQINTELGLETAYTGTVDLFLRARGLP
jgi:acetyl esterase/lipase